MTLRTHLRPRKCKQCREQFMPAKSMQCVCSPLCAAKYGAVQAAKKKHAAELADRRETRARKEAIKPRSQWQKEAQAAFNAWVRERDAKLPCISCGRFHEGQNHAGHFLSTGARPNLRFEPANVHKQCQPCNVHLSGNLINYRLSLVERIGLAAVEALEADHTPRHYTVDDLKRIKADYTARARELRKAAE